MRKVIISNFTQLEFRKTKPIPVKLVWTKAEVPTHDRKILVMSTCRYFLLTQRKF